MAHLASAPISKLGYGAEATRLGKDTNRSRFFMLFDGKGSHQSQSVRSMIKRPFFESKLFKPEEDGTKRLSTLPTSCCHPRDGVLKAG